MKHRMTNALRSVLQTAGIACCLLLAVSLLLIGVRALLPDHKNILYTFPPSQNTHPASDGEAPELYPWRYLTVEVEDAEPVEFAYGLLSMLDLYGKLDASDAQVVCDPGYNLFGVRSLNFAPERISGTEDGYELVSPDKEQTTYTHTVSFAYDLRFDAACFLHVRRNDASDIPADVQQQGLQTLTDYAAVHPDGKEDPISAYFACLLQFPNADPELYELQKETPTVFLYDGEVYLYYTGKGLSLTLMADPADLHLTGFSLEHR